MRLCGHLVVRVPAHYGRDDGSHQSCASALGAVVNTCMAAVGMLSSACKQSHRDSDAEGLLHEQQGTFAGNGIFCFLECNFL